MNVIKNPILPGFHPDPSIIRVGEDYYIATSTFQWFPGVQIHHSRDLKNWELISRPLNRVSQLDMKGEADNLGVWAPCLSYDNGIFYLVYSNIRQMDNVYRDCHNFLVTTDDIYGEWSEPIPVKNDYADYSLFHDGDKKWMVFPYDYTEQGLEGRAICIQEYSVQEKKLVGPVIGIFQGTELGTSEGPHLYKYGGYYYLIVAEGGTGYGHAVTVTRSKDITGPYEVDPEYPMLTARNNEHLLIQKAGHADLVETPSGEWYMVHLCGRPFRERGKCILGRETAIQKVRWTEDGWLRLAVGGNEPQELVECSLKEHAWEKKPARDDFNALKLDINFQTLRMPLEESVLSFTERPGFLRLRGKESLASPFCQAFVARRQEHFCYTATTELEFEPVNPLQAAGLICYYNSYAYHYFQITWKKGIGKVLQVVTGRGQEVMKPFAAISVNDIKKCYLRVNMEGEWLQFQYSADEIQWENFGEALDATILTDEFAHPGMMNFTGAFVGICCQDLSGNDCPADFDYFEYVGIK